MGLRVRTNVASLNAQRRMGQTTNSLQGSQEKLASGYRINKAADDAAGLAMSESAKARIRSLEQAKRNANDGVSLIQVAEGSMNEVSNVLVRLRELATQAASDTIGNTERSFTNKEYTQMVKEIDRIANTTEWNGTPLMTTNEDNDGLFTLHIGAGDGSAENTDTIKIDAATLALNTETLGLGQGAEIGPVEANGSFDRQDAADKLGVIDQALETIATNRSYLGAQQNRLGSAIRNLGVQVENLNAANSRIRDVDFASETAKFTQEKILQQAGASILAQANAAPEIALSLLR